MMISVLLMICLQLFEHGKSNFLTVEQWKWEISCREHPFATEAGRPMMSNNSSNVFKQCILKFYYPNKLNRSNIADDIEAKDFCKTMYPDRLVEADSSKPLEMKCIYENSRKCEDPDAYPIGLKCVSASTKAAKFEAATMICEERGGASLISTGDIDVIHFFSRLYKWQQPTPAIWAKDKYNNIHHIFMSYSAIGNHRPGSSIIVEGETLKTEAIVMCIGKSTPNPGATKDASYCDMLNKLLIIPAKAIGGNCYHATQSLMLAKQHENDKRLATVDHFNTACRARTDELNFAVAPTSEEQTDILNSCEAIFKKKTLLLPGALSQYWSDGAPNHFIQRDLDVSSFQYSVARRRRVNNKDTVKIETFSVHHQHPNISWLDTYPTKQKGIMVPGILLWDVENQKMKNVDSVRRAHALCGSGRAVDIRFKCPDEKFEIAIPRPDYAVCFKAVAMDCAEFFAARDRCRTTVHPDAKLAPMQSVEEEMAISRTAKTVIQLHNNSVFLGAIKKDYDKEWSPWSSNYIVKDEGYIYRPFVWDFDSTEVGNEKNGKYNRWMKGQPDKAENCDGDGDHRRTDGGNRDGNCFFEGCLALKFENGHPAGLNDVLCQDHCLWKWTKYYEQKLEEKSKVALFKHVLKAIVCAVNATREEM